MSQGNEGDGIVAGTRSLVTSNIANDNGGDGIEVLCPGTVTNNEALGNFELASRGRLFPEQSRSSGRGLGRGV